MFRKTLWGVSSNVCRMKVTILPDATAKWQHTSTRTAWCVDIRKSMPDWDNKFVTETTINLNVPGFVRKHSAMTCWMLLSNCTTVSLAKLVSFTYQNRSNSLFISQQYEEAKQACCFGAEKRTLPAERFRQCEIEYYRRAGMLQNTLHDLPRVLGPSCTAGWSVWSSAVKRLFCARLSVLMAKSKALLTGK